MGRRVLLLMSCALLCSGCFVFDELDSGVEILDKNSPRGAAKPTPSSSAAKKKGDDSSFDLAEEGSAALDAVEDWWDDLRKPAPDPNDGIVRCRLNGAIRFKRESDCRAAGGQPSV